jgi:hypothetical protein
VANSLRSSVIETRYDDGDGDHDERKDAEEQSPDFAGVLVKYGPLGLLPGSLRSCRGRHDCDPPLESVQPFLPSPCAFG